MFRFQSSHWWSVLLVLLALPSLASADVRLPGVISDRMVLQRDRPIPIWGWAAADEEVAVVLGESQPVTVKAGADGKWRVDLPAMKAGGPHKLTVRGKNLLTIQDILIGEVWVCFGQSNMQWKTSQCTTWKQDAPRTVDPQLRLASFLASPNTYPQEELGVSWQPSNIGTAQGFSAVAYYFGKHLREKLDVPVGIIHSSAGAIPIEAWTPASGCMSMPSQQKIVRLVNQVQTDFRKQRETALDAWIPMAKEAVAKEKPLPAMPAVSDLIVQRGWMPTTLYNSSIHPIVPFGIRGAIMYQGEANNGNGLEYIEKLQALIGGWRKAWGQGDFPFLYVQLAPWSRYPAGNLEGIWEAQRLALDVIPNTGMAVTTDLVPNLDDIHPPRKKEVGERLALWALAKTYGQEKLVYSGPLFKSATLDASKITISFDHVGSGLASRNEKPLDSFEVGDANGFVEASATIAGDKIVVSSEKMPAPLHVRFGWKNNATPNLINKEGLPASPFRTDCVAPGFSTGSQFAKMKRVELSPEYAKGTIRYTLDGSTPTKDSPAYTKPIEISETTTISARTFADNGQTSLNAKRVYTKVAAVAHDGKMLAPGLDYEFYIGRWTSMPNFATLKADRNGITDSLELPSFSENFMCAYRLRGYIEIPADGEYIFTSRCHGGAQVVMDDKMILDDDGFHAPIEKASAPVKLTAGKHAITLLYHEGGGGPNFALFYQSSNLAKQPVPATAWFRSE